MIKQKIVVSSVAVTLSAAMLLCAALGNKNLKLFRTAATECTHEHVEHYEADGSHIEHWACCECHHAWADSGRTIELSTNTASDRSRIDFDSKYFHAALQSQDNGWKEGGWEWVREPAVIYDAEYGFAYSVSEDNLRQVFFESNDTSTQLESGKYYGMKVYNNTLSTLDVTVVSREWGGANTRTVSVAAGSSVFVYGDANLWNYNAKKGAAVRINVNDYSAFSGELVVSALKVLDLAEDPNFFNTSYIDTSSNWTWDATLGFELLNNRIYQKFDYANVTQAFIQSIDTATSIPNNKYYVSHFVNNTNKTLNVTGVSRGWNSAWESVEIPAGESKWVYATSFVWNYNENKGGTFRVTESNGFTGEILITAPKIVNEPIYSFELTNSEWHQIPYEVGYDENVGFYYSFDTSTMEHFYITNCPQIDPTLYSGVRMKMYNGGAPTNPTIWSGDWNDHGPIKVGNMATDEWTTFVVTADVWNGDANSYRIEFYDYTFTGELRIAWATELVAK